MWPWGETRRSWATLNSIKYTQRGHNFVLKLSHFQPAAVYFPRWQGGRELRRISRRCGTRRTPYGQLCPRRTQRLGRNTLGLPGSRRSGRQSGWWVLHLIDSIYMPDNPLLLLLRRTHSRRGIRRRPGQSLGGSQCASGRQRRRTWLHRSRGAQSWSHCDLVLAALSPAGISCWSCARLTHLRPRRHQPHPKGQAAQEVLADQPRCK